MLLATFMGGMCLGSLLLPRLVSAQRHALRVYALIELGIGVFGILVLYLVPLAGGVYTAWTGYGLKGFLLRGIVAAACLLPPTLLMGATLPALARQINATQINITEQGVPWLGFFYGANIAGAVLGCLLSGFYLLREYDVYAATYVADGDQPVDGRARIRACRGNSERRRSRRSCQRTARLYAVRSAATGLRRHRAIRALRVGRRSDLDAHAGTALRRIGLYAFHHRGGFSRRPRDWQRYRGLALSNPRVAAHGLGLVPIAGGLRNRLDRVQSGRIAPLLADQPLHLVKHLVQLRAGSRARVLGPVASDAPLGCKLPVGARGGRHRRTGCRQADGRSLRRQYLRGHRWSSRREPAPHRLGGIAARRASAHCVIHQLPVCSFCCPSRPLGAGWSGELDRYGRAARRLLHSSPSRRSRKCSSRMAVTRPPGWAKAILFTRAKA